MLVSMDLVDGRRLVSRDVGLCHLFVNSDIGGGRGLVSRVKRLRSQLRLVSPGAVVESDTKIGSLGRRRRNLVEGGRAGSSSNIDGGRSGMSHSKHIP